MYCNCCGRLIEGIPSPCARCGGRYCPDCHLPEVHACPGRAEQGTWYQYSQEDGLPSHPETIESPKQGDQDLYENRQPRKPSRIPAGLKRISLSTWLFPIFLVLGLLGWYLNNIIIFDLGIYGILFLYVWYAVRLSADGHGGVGPALLVVPILFLLWIYSPGMFRSSVSVLITFLVVVALSITIITAGGWILRSTRGGVRPRLSIGVFSLILMLVAISFYAGLIPWQPDFAHDNSLSGAIPMITPGISSLATAPTIPTVVHTFVTPSPVPTVSLAPEPTQAIANFSEYATGKTSKTYRYVMDGKNKKMPLTLYTGVDTYLDTRTSGIYIGMENESFQTMLDDPVQAEYLGDLVDYLRSTSTDTDVQAKNAVRFVQNIPYDFNESRDLTKDLKYPYETVYDDRGVCGDKSVLLAYLLRELGYDVVIFIFEAESHGAVGIKCQSPYEYRGTGYCFVETTVPSIITDAEGEYAGGSELVSMPDVYHISGGREIVAISDEYNDLKEFNRLNSVAKTQGNKLYPEEYARWSSIVYKYGLQLNYP